MSYDGDENGKGDDAYCDDAYYNHGSDDDVNCYDDDYHGNDDDVYCDGDVYYGDY